MHFYDRNSLKLQVPAIPGRAVRSRCRIPRDNDMGVGAQHSLPLNGQFYLNYNRSSADSSYFSDSGQSSNTSNYTDDIVNTGASFHPLGNSH